MTNHCRHYEDKNKGVELWKKDFNFILSLKRALSIYIVYLFHLISFNINDSVLQAGYIKLGIIWHEINYISCAAYQKKPVSQPFSLPPSLPPSLTHLSRSVTTKDYHLYIIMQWMTTSFCKKKIRIIWKITTIVRWILGIA